MQLQSTLTCPKCSYQAVEVMPTDACQFSSKSNSVPNMPHQKDGPKTALAEFKPFLASVEAGQSATREPSEKLLQRFMQWRQKSTSTPGP
jgi:hypothetical protein